VSGASWNSLREANSSEHQPSAVSIQPESGAHVLMADRRELMAALIAES
jgi:hypothetical protein